MTSVTSRFSITELPSSLPGKCLICGSTGGDDGRKFIDFGLEIDFYGVVYFCTFCFLEGHNELGWLSPDEALALNNRLAEFESQVAELEAENVKLRVALSNLNFLKPLDEHGRSGIKPTSSVETPKTVKSTNSRSSKSSDGGGSTDVSENVDLPKELEELI